LVTIARRHIGKLQDVGGSLGETRALLERLAALESGLAAARRAAAAAESRIRGLRRRAADAEAAQVLQRIRPLNLPHYSLQYSLSHVRDLRCTSLF
jgi:hypothetical protein